MVSQVITLCSMTSFSEHYSDSRAAVVRVDNNHVLHGGGATLRGEGVHDHNLIINSTH